MQVLDLSSVRLVYSSSYFKSLSTGGNVSKALVNKYSKSSINTPGSLFISNASEGRLNRDRGGLSNLAKTMVSVLHKELEFKVERLKYKKLEVMQPRIRNKSELPVGE